MRGRSWSGLILGSLAWALVACQAPEPAPAPPTASPTVGLAPERFATPRPLATTAAPTLPVTPAPLPATLTPGPTSTPDRPQEVLAPNGWQVVGNRDRGVQTALPDRKSVV